MKGVIYSVFPDAVVEDLSHEVRPGGIWQASHLLYHVSSSWPEGTVFVSALDPDVGTERKVFVALSRDGHYFVSADNGVLTHIAREVGFKEVRVVDEARHRRPGSEGAPTWTGRDLFAYVGARLSSKKVRLKDFGPRLQAQMRLLEYRKAELVGRALRGTLENADSRYGNIWTNIPVSLAEKAAIRRGAVCRVRLLREGREVSETKARFVKTFSDVPVGEPLIYVNGFLNLTLAVNRGSFVKEFDGGAGPGWEVEISKL